MDMLREYSTASTPIGHGRRISSIRITGNEPGTMTLTGRQVTDAQIQQAIQSWIANKTVPAPTDNTLYFVYLPPNVLSIMPSGDLSCSQFCGYHNAIGNVYYAVVPYVSCNGCVFPGDFLDTLTEVSSHELVEAITDPALNAWWDSATGNEIGDICNRQTERLGGFMIQSEWSNSQQACVIAPRRIAPPGASVTLSKQLNNQLDVVFADTNGALNVMWVVDAGIWNGPAALTGPNTVPAGAQIALAKQFDNQLNALFVDNNGVVNVMWVVDAEAWNGPIGVS